MSEELEPPTPDVRTRMQTQRRGDTLPEVALRRLLFAKGLRYRVGYAVPGAPRRSIDIAFPGTKVAVFVDGCYWHRCPDHHVPAKRNGAWWQRKLQANVDRDLHTNRMLEQSGWQVVRIWEHEDMRLAAERVCSVVRDRGRQGPTDRSPVQLPAISDQS